MISLGIGDPDEPTYPYIVKAMQEAVADPATHQYPSNRGRGEFRQAFADFYDRRFGVEIDPETEVIPAIGAKECIYNLCFAFLDPGDVALASDPGYPVYTGGPILAGATPELLPLVPELGFAPDLSAVPADVAAKARLMFLNYPNNPTGAVVPEGFFEMVVSFAREHEILVVHDNAYSETTYDGYVAPSFLATPGAKEVGVEVFSLSKGYNMTGWRCAAILGNAEAIQTYWRLKTNVDSGLFEAVQMAGAAALQRPQRAAGADERDLRPPPRPRRLRPARDRRRGRAPKGTIYVWAPVPEGHTSTSFAELVLEEAAVVVSPGSMYGPSGEGFFRISSPRPTTASKRRSSGCASTSPRTWLSGFALGLLAPVAVEAAPLVCGGTAWSSSRRVSAPAARLATALDGGAARSRPRTSSRASCGLFAQALADGRQVLGRRPRSGRSG